MTEPPLTCPECGADHKAMQSCLDRLGIPLSLVWNPDPSERIHGKIDESSKTLLIYDGDVDQAWQTLMHEVLEWRMRDALRLYREITNSLIELVEKECYRRKEKFLESVPTIVKVIDEARGLSTRRPIKSKYLRR